MDDLQEMEQVQDNSFINDMRDSSDFRSITFSGYKKADVKKQLLLSIFNNKIEQSCYWSAEMVCAGHYMDLWEICLFYLGKHIHLGNPKLAIYLQKRFQVFKNIMVQGAFFDELQLRNNPTIRNMFAEIVCVFCMSPKKPSMEPVKINKDDEFDMTVIADKLKAPNTNYSANIMKKEDPKELTIGINELAYHVSRNKHVPNMSQACYWVEWIISFDQICKKRKQPLVASNRDNIPVEYKYQKEVIWIIWDVLFLEVQDDKFLTSLLNSILQLFCLKFTPALIRKRHYLLYYAISVVTEPFIRDIQMIQNKGLVENTIQQIATVYKQIKKSEVAPQTDYLFHGLHDPNNTQKSLNKINTVFGNSFPKVPDPTDFPEL